MRRVLTVMTALVLTMVSTVAAQEKEPPIVGLWQASMDTPHGKMALEFDFTFNAKEKKNVSGTLTSATLGSFPLSGELTGGTLTFAVTGGPSEMTFTGSLKDRNTLVGVMSAHNTDFECVAKRAVK